MIALLRDDGDVMMSPEQTLWRVVLYQIFHDANLPTPCHERDEARNWLNTPSEDHDWVIEAAGYEPDARLHAIDDQTNKSKAAFEGPRFENTVPKVL
jgi:hypothetical protein